MCKTKKLKNKGFTLIELLIVLGIMGIIASMIGPGTFKYFEKNRAQNSAEKTMTLLNEGFSAARSQAKSFRILFTPGDLTTSPPAPYSINLQTCDKIKLDNSCENPQPYINQDKEYLETLAKDAIFTENMDSGAPTLNNQSFIFRHPYGNILDNKNLFTEENNDQLSIIIGNNFKFKIIVRKTSGLTYLEAIN